MIARDVANVKVAQRKVSLAGRTPMDALFHELKNSPNWVYESELSNEGKVKSLFFAYVENCQSAAKWHKVFLMDCTYKTNR